MKSFDEVLQIVNEELQKVNWQRNPIELYEPIAYTLSLGGKRIRPALALMATDVFEGSFTDVMPAALALEIFHNFTLLHDDVMDKALKRRGKPTVHARWNENFAILSGDEMSIEAYKMLANVPGRCLKQVLEEFSAMATKVCEGQQYDMNFEHMQHVGEEDYIHMIRLKTAVLIAASLKIGALIAGADATNCDKMYEFGINLGLAFQLQDDLLDVYGDEKVFGKSIGGDILCNKKTYMLLTALNRAEGQEKMEMEKLLSANTLDAREKISAVTALYDRLEVKSACEEKIEYYHQKSLAVLESINTDENRLLPLRQLVEKLMNRAD